MGILDGFLFWIGKALAELLVFGIVVIVFGVIYAAIYLWDSQR